MLGFEVLLIAGFIAVHLFKMARLYLVLMEHRIPFGRFVLLYFRTTFVNLIVPFKLGEIYRVEEIARETRVWQVGLLSVLVDRYFDIAALVVLLLPLDLFFGGRLSVITIVFVVVILAVAFVYMKFPPSYTYLNRYLIMRRASSRSMAALKGLDVTKNWYDFTKKLITGRSALIVAASFLGWICEIVTLWAVAAVTGLSFGLGDFPGYIEAIFVTGSSDLMRTYTNSTAFAFLVLTIVGYACKLLFGRRKDRV